MTALLPDLTPGEAVLWDAMTSFGWTPAQCRMAFAAAARGTVKLTRVTYDTDGEGGMVLEARLLVVPGLDVAVI